MATDRYPSRSSLARPRDSGSRGRRSHFSGIGNARISDVGNRVRRATLRILQGPRRGRRLLALARVFRMTKLLERMLDENEFLSPHGVRALSRHYLEHPFDFVWRGIHYGMKYLPAESNSGLFGDNSNCRGPVWVPVSFQLIESLRRFMPLGSPLNALLVPINV
jgi:hypothetical protein